MIISNNKKKGTNYKLVPDVKTKFSLFLLNRKVLLSYLRKRYA